LEAGGASLIFNNFTAATQELLKPSVKYLDDEILFKDKPMFKLLSMNGLLNVFDTLSPPLPPVLIDRLIDGSDGWELARLPRVTPNMTQAQWRRLREKHPYGTFAKPMYAHPACPPEEMRTVLEMPAIPWTILHGMLQNPKLPPDIAEQIYITKREGRLAPQIDKMLLENPDCPDRIRALIALSD
jgi:hypothetical protein